MEKMLYRQESLDLYRKLGSILRKERGRMVEETIYICKREDYVLSCVISETSGTIFSGRRDCKSIYYQNRLTRDEAEMWIKENFSDDAANQLFQLLDDMYE